MNLVRNTLKRAKRNILSYLMNAGFIAGEVFLGVSGFRAKNENRRFLERRKILIVRLDEIGDVVLTTPFIRELRRNCPHSWITLVVKTEVYNLVEICPYVNEILVYSWKVRGPFRIIRRHIHALRLAVFSLWKKKYDLAILPRWDIDYYHGSFLAYFSGAKERVAYSEYVNPEKHKANTGYDRLFTRTIKDDSLKHEAEYNLNMIRFLGGEVHDDGLELWMNEGDEGFAKSIVEGYKLNGHLIGIGPGAVELRRRWPVKRFSKLIEWLIKEYKFKITLLGNRKEAYLGEQLESMLEEDYLDSVVNLTGKTTIRQVAVMMKRCVLYIGNDTGLIHIAAAVGVPVIEISCWFNSGNAFSAKSPYRFSPWRTRYVIVNPKKPLSPCKEECISSGPHCIRQVSVENVKESAKALLHKLNIIR